MLSPAEKLKAILGQWTEYVSRQGQTPVVIQITGKKHSGYVRTCQSLADQQFACVHFSAMKNGKQIELLRFPYFDVEVVCDDRPSGKIGATGDPDNIARLMRLLGGVPVPSS